MSCKWLPEFYESPDWNNFEAYEKKLYEYFKRVYFSNDMYFNGKRLKYRRHPIIDNREELYYHLTCQDYKKDGKRLFDSERIKRIDWTKAFIEHYNCQESCCDNKPIFWTKRKNNKVKHKIYHNNFLVIVEDRVNYCLLITGFYVHEEYYRRGLIKEYEKSH